MRSEVQLLRHDVSHLVFLGKVGLEAFEVGPPLTFKTLKRIRSRAWRGQGRDLGPGVTFRMQPVDVGGFWIT